MIKRINLNLNFISNLKNNKRINEFIKQLQERAKPFIERWVRLTQREKQLLIILSGVIVAFILFSIISAAINIDTQLNKRYDILQAYKLDAQSIQNELKILSKTTANEFSTVSLTRVQGDVTQALGVTNPDVILQDNILTIKADNVSFESVILLLEQLRKSYGVFPTKLKITQSRSGYVNFNATFFVSQ
ncbi:MAG: type II secretion system protein GspM [Neisseriaceae bacterium]